MNNLCDTCANDRCPVVIKREQMFPTPLKFATVKCDNHTLVPFAYSGRPAGVPEVDVQATVEMINDIMQQPFASHTPPIEPARSVPAAGVPSQCLPPRAVPYSDEEVRDFYNNPAITPPNTAGRVAPVRPYSELNHTNGPAATPVPPDFTMENALGEARNSLNKVEGAIAIIHGTMGPVHERLNGMLAKKAQDDIFLEEVMQAKTDLMLLCDDLLAVFKATPDTSPTIPSLAQVLMAHNKTLKKYGLI